MNAPTDEEIAQRIADRDEAMKALGGAEPVRLIVSKRILRRLDENHAARLRATGNADH